MTTQPAPINQIRYKKRLKDDAWIKSFLHQMPFGVLATDYDGQPFVKPTTFVYQEDDHAIYIHGALEGRMRTNLELNPRVSFCVAEMGRLLPADTAMEVGVEYSSVVVFGRIEVLNDPNLARHALQLMLDRFFPHLKSGVDYRPITDQELSATAVYRINIESWSGKGKQAPQDFPGAFYFNP